ncbi:MAG: hypothetical protein OSA99_04450 [Acidimicrobiales bacterium]|nr:hypothetical protein [Acidimicrobiales bacterium]
MPLHLWEAIHDADARSEPLFDLDPTIIGSTPPSLQRVLLAAATLWCRTLVWPTVREIAANAAVAASTSLHAVGSSAQLRTVLIESERRTINNLWIPQLDGIGPDARAVARAFHLRVSRLAAIEQPLAALPMLAGLALGDPLMASAAMRPYQQSIATGMSDAPAVA